MDNSYIMGKNVKKKKINKVESRDICGFLLWLKKKKVSSKQF